MPAAGGLSGPGMGGFDMKTMSQNFGAGIQS